MNSAEKVIEMHHLAGQQWTHKGFHGVLHTLFPVSNALFKSLHAQLGISPTVAVLFVEKDSANWYWNDRDMVVMREYAIDHVRENPQFLEDLLEKWQMKLGLFKEQLPGISADSLARLTNEGLIQRYEEFNRTYQDEFGLAIGFQDPFSMHSDRFLEPLFKEVLSEEKYNEQFILLFSPVNESFINQELKDRYRLVAYIQQNPELVSLLRNDVKGILARLKEFPEFHKKVTIHTEQYHWIQNNYATVRNLDSAYFVGEIKKSLSTGMHAQEEIQKMDEQIALTVQGKKDLIEKLHLDQALRDLIRISEVFAYMQDERKKYVLISNYYQQLFRAEIGKRSGYTMRELDYSIVPEIRSLLESAVPTHEELTDRYDCCCVVYTVAGYELLSGQEAREVYDRLFKTSATETEISGQVASAGIALGPVRIVKTTDDLGSVEQGDILVASMTRPEMIVAIRKAAAIVTDEGGITSHAAIVSREMNIPCIIGTKNATTVLQNGEIVEVDASTGIVRKVA